MANAEHLAILKTGAAVWNRRWEEGLDVQPELIRADLTGTNLSGVTLRGVAYDDNANWPDGFDAAAAGARCWVSIAQ